MSDSQFINLSVSRSISLDVGQFNLDRSFVERRASEWLSAKETDRPETDHEHNSRPCNYLIAKTIHHQ